ncbi:MAG: shikimate kinase [Rhodospirillales bacterium]|nr:shikimate kinase [Rhodospirillales bacterium]
MSNSAHAHVNANSSADMTPDRPVVLIGLMGAGKTTVGRRLATRLGVPFVDSDAEIEAAAGYSVQDIFDKYGESAFREGERKVMLRLLKGPVQIIATGGGAFMDPDIRQAIADNGISVWLKAELSVLLERVSRRNHRPLLKTGDPKEILERLMKERYPVYAESDIVVESAEGPHKVVLGKIVAALERHGGRIPDGPSDSGTPDDHNLDP